MNDKKVTGTLINMPVPSVFGGKLLHTNDQLSITPVHLSTTARIFRPDRALTHTYTLLLFIKTLQRPPLYNGQIILPQGVKDYCPITRRYVRSRWVRNHTDGQLKRILVTSPPSIFRVHC